MNVFGEQFFFTATAASFSIVERTNPSFSPARDSDRPPSPDPGLIRVGAPASHGGGSQRSGGCWGWGRGARTRSNGAFEIPNSKAARERLTRTARDRRGQNRCDIDDVMGDRAGQCVVDTRPNRTRLGMGSIVERRKTDLHRACGRSGGLACAERPAAAAGGGGGGSRASESSRRGGRLWTSS